MFSFSASGTASAAVAAYVTCQEEALQYPRDIGTILDQRNSSTCTLNPTCFSHTPCSVRTHAPWMATTCLVPNLPSQTAASIQMLTQMWVNVPAKWTTAVRHSGLVRIIWAVHHLRIAQTVWLVHHSGQMRTSQLSLLGLVRSIWTLHLSAFLFITTLAVCPRPIPS